MYIDIQILYLRGYNVHRYTDTLSQGVYRYTETLSQGVFRYTDTLSQGV